MNDSTTKKKDSTCKKIGLIFIKRHRAFITTQCVVITLFIIGVLFLAAGILFIVMTNNLFEFEIRYDDICVNQTKNCLIYFNLTEELRGDIVFLYRLSNFYQNHRRIFQSKSYGQLKGEYLTYNDLSTCSPMISEGNSRDPSKLYLPCGLASFSFFNDTYRFVDDEIDFNFTDHNISLKTDREKLFKPLHSRYTTGLRWLENMTENGQTNEHFIVWMRTAAMPNFIKLYSKCHNCHISPGYYAISVDMNYPLEMYKGSRYIMISTTSALGSKSYFLSVTYLVIGGLSLLFSLSFLLQLLICPSKFGEVGEIFSHKVEQAQTIDQRLTSTNLPRLPTARRAFSQGNSREHSSSNNLPSEIPLSQRSLSLSVNTRLSHSPRSAQASLRNNDQYLKRSRQSGKNSGKVK